MKQELVYYPASPAIPRVIQLKSFNRLDEIVTVHENWLDRLRGRVASSRVGIPAGIAFRDETLYVCDTDDNVVHAWDLGTGAARRIGEHGDALLSKPVDVDVDEAGTVYVADAERGAVLAYSADGESSRTIRADRAGAYRPASVAIVGDRLYVADIAAHRVDVFSRDDGAELDGVGGIGAAPGRLYFPMGVEIGSDGRVYVSDMMNARVQVFDPALAPVTSFGRPGNHVGDMGKPRHLAVGPDGVVFIADVEFAHVHMYSEKGEILMLFGGLNDEAGGTPMPVGVAIARSLPDALASLIPPDFTASYFVFVSNTVARKRIALFAVGVGAANGSAVSAAP
jgi:DNA-binding beta-propeller fold protein YncE